MSNGTTHRTAAFAAVAALTAREERKNGKLTLAPIVNGSAAALLTGIPDYLEPAVHPNHRQFFHSVVFAGLVGYGVHKAYKWQPTDGWEEFLRWLAIIGGTAYLVHLALDAFTAKSLPLVGKI
ncbi:MAG TPA: metal-dependent hydrolase [Burkholderiales bacterium]|nr:metal-dependent hydrolase [Burkholderiales bacterium]